MSDRRYDDEPDAEDPAAPLDPALPGDGEERDTTDGDEPEVEPEAE